MKTSSDDKCGILLVEDHEDTREVTRRLLESSGHRVSTAGGIATALGLASQERFHLLITDVGLPDGSGLELLEQIRGLYPIDGVVLSGYGMANDIRDSKTAGFTHHLTKPVAIDMILKVIEGIMATADCEKPPGRSVA